MAYDEKKETMKKLYVIVGPYPPRKSYFNKLLSDYELSYEDGEEVIGYVKKLINNSIIDELDIKHELEKEVKDRSSINKPHENRSVDKIRLNAMFELKIIVGLHEPRKPYFYELLNKYELYP
ncbi:hypothetical protein ACA135_04765 [Methanobrevibacter acididurans]|jgi:hypothetical protein|uniref:hypothetical protein n=1 Tax=Methanobrevibacter TaxID=2172 RepID=UPI0038FC75DF